MSRHAAHRAACSQLPQALAPSVSAAVCMCAGSFRTVPQQSRRAWPPRPRERHLTDQQGHQQLLHTSMRMMRCEHARFSIKASGHAARLAIVHLASRANFCSTAHTRSPRISFGRPSHFASCLSCCRGATGGVDALAPADRSARDGFPIRRCRGFEAGTPGAAIALLGAGGGFGRFGAPKTTVTEPFIRFYDPEQCPATCSARIHAQPRSC